MGILREIEKTKQSKRLSTCSEHSVENLLAQSARRFFRRVGLFDGWDTLVSESRAVNNRRLFTEGSPAHRTHRDKVHFLGAPEGRAHVQIPAEPETEEDGYVDVTRDEVLRIPHEEVLIAVDEDEDRRPEYAPNGEPGLKRIVVREHCEVAALRFVSVP